MIPKELSKKFTAKTFPINTGSTEWWNIKTDFIVESEAVAGSLSFFDRSIVDKDKISKLSNQYRPINSIESDEKEIIIEKIELGLEIYRKILESLI